MLFSGQFLLFSEGLVMGALEKLQVPAVGREGVKMQRRDGQEVIQKAGVLMGVVEGGVQKRRFLQIFLSLRKRRMVCRSDERSRRTQFFEELNVVSRMSFRERMEQGVEGGYRGRLIEWGVEEELMMEVGELGLV